MEPAQPPKQWEVEQKFHLHDSPSLQAVLEELQFSQTGLEHHRDTYWQHPSRDFRQSDEAFRIRRVNDQACVTYKGPRRRGAGGAAVKTREEIELDIGAGQFDEWSQMLTRLGFAAQPTVVKSRSIYQSSHVVWSDIVVAVDTVQRLGDFVEIELLVRAEEQLSEAQARIAQLAGQLGLVHHQPHSYLTQLLALDA